MLTTVLIVLLKAFGLQLLALMLLPMDLYSAP